MKQKFGTKIFPKYENKLLFTNMHFLYGAFQRKSDKSILNILVVLTASPFQSVYVFLKYVIEFMCYN